MSGNTAEFARSDRPPIHLLRDASLFLDFDGTLVQIASTPDGVHVSEAVRDLLSSLDRLLGGRIAILSGRSSGEINALIHPMKIVVGGSHGLELVRPDAPAAAPQRPDAIGRAIVALRGLADDHQGVVVEEKPFGVAVHYRLAPNAASACKKAVDRVAKRESLYVQAGKMVYEVRPAGPDKGTALNEVMRTPPFAGTFPVVLGDDLTDEAAFAASKKLGGAGVLVGEPRETAATYRLEGVEESLAWLAEAARALA